MSDNALSLTLNQLRSCLRAHLPDIAERYRIASLGVLGSYVRDEEQPGSDSDLLVEFREPPTLFEFIRLENELSALLGVNVDFWCGSAGGVADGTRRICRSCGRGVRFSIEDAVEDGLTDEKAIEGLAVQICYRAADLAYLLDMRGERLSDYSLELRETPSGYLSWLFERDEEDA